MPQASASGATRVRGVGRPQPSASGWPIADAYSAASVRAARQTYLDALPIAAAIVAPTAGEQTLVGRNRGFEALFGNAELPDLAPEIAGALRAFLGGGEAGRELEWRNGAGIGAQHFHVRLGRVFLPALGNEGCLICFVDRTAEMDTAHSLRTQMTRDSLTGLANRIAFDEAIETLIADEAVAPETFAVLIVDLKRFSRVNESMGTVAGDELLITAARRLRSALRGEDMLARLGGDEFSVLLRKVGDEADCLNAARRIEDALARPFRLSEIQLQITGAIGCARMGRRVDSADALIRNAQFALKRAKLSGRIEFYRVGEARRARHELSIEADLRAAIEHDALHLEFQPLIELATGRIAGFEALARWRHPAHGEIAPGRFIHIAEEAGLIVELGRWALDSAVKTLAAWDREAGAVLPLGISVNVSPVQLAHDNVHLGVAEALAAHGISGARLTLEITESAIVGDPDRAARLLGALKTIDARIAMDDFGTGYSSLASLQRLPIDMLKIDRSFVSAMLGDGDSLAIVRAVLGLAQALGMATTAEGIESRELARTLGALGCTFGQGFYFSRALCADEALAFYHERNA